MVMERSVVIMLVLVMSAATGMIDQVQAAPDPRDYQVNLRPSQGLGIGSPIPRGNAMPRPPPKVMHTTTTAPAEMSPDEYSRDSTLRGPAVFKSPSNWFLPSLKKWPNFPFTKPRGIQADPAPSFDDFVVEYATENFKQGNERRSMMRPAHVSYLRFLPRTIEDEWHPRYIPVQKHQRLLKIVG